MLRRAVSLFLLPCMLLGQLAPLASAHLHQSGTPVGHDLRPHTHARTLQTAVAHVHGSEGHHGHSHEHSDQYTEADEEFLSDEPQSSEAVDPGFPPSHDDDAIYVSSETLPPVQRSTDRLGLDVDFQGLLLVAPAHTLFAGQHSAKIRVATSPPHAQCPRYVRHLTLLI